MKFQGAKLLKKTFKIKAKLAQRRKGAKAQWLKGRLEKFGAVEKVDSFYFLPLRYFVPYFVILCGSMN